MHGSTPTFDPEEEIALFRAMIIGPLAARPLDHGELAAELRALSKKRFRPPGRDVTRTYSVATLERWFAAYRRAGITGLRRKRRRDVGRARALSTTERELLLEIRIEFPSASVPLVLRTLDIAGTLPKGTVSPQTLRRLYQQAGLPRLTRRQRDGTLEEDRQRLRWQTSSICSLWHADVCHALRIPGEARKHIPVLVHALLDDYSRYIVRLEVRTTEREQDMLEIFAHTLREHGVSPDRLYTDGGATYTGKLLPLICERLGTHLIHPQPRDPAARGKGERLFRTMREQCLDHIRGARSPHDVHVRLLAWRERYHRSPHAGLMGRTPEQLWKQGLASAEHQRRACIDEDQLREAYRVREGRRVRKDATLSIGGVTFELDAAWLAGKQVTIERSLLALDEAWVLFEGQRIALHPVDPERNARRARKAAPKKPLLPTGPQSAPGAHAPLVPNPADVELDELLDRTHTNDIRTGKRENR